MNLFNILISDFFSNLKKHWKILTEQVVHTYSNNFL